MALRAGTLLALAVTSAVLATLVPGVFDPPSAREAAAVEVLPAADVAVPTMPATPPVDVVPAPAEPFRAAPPKAVKPIDPFAPRALAERRVRVPPGCERLVSPLVRSAASSVIGRCIT